MTNEAPSLGRSRVRADLFERTHGVHLREIWRRPQDWCSARVVSPIAAPASVESRNFAALSAPARPRGEICRNWRWHRPKAAPFAFTRRPSMSRHSPSIPGIVVLATLAAGCASEPNWISPKVPNPVLISRVDRIGGHVAEPALTLAEVEQEAEDIASASTTTEGNMQVTRVRASSASSVLLTAAIERATAKRSDVDVHVDRLSAGGYAFVAGGAAVLRKWVGIRGRAVPAGGAR
jgi:hypothetical protein